MKLKINPNWLRRMAAKEGNGILSVGGFFSRLMNTGIFGTPTGAFQLLREWRNEQAEALNTPRHRVMPDHCLLEIANMAGNVPAAAWWFIGNRKR